MSDIIDQHRKQIEDLQRQLHSAEARFSMSRTERDSFQQALAEKGREVAELRAALATKDRQLAAANARCEMLKAENNRLCVEGHEYRAIAENANAALAKENATLKGLLSRPQAEPTLYVYCSSCGHVYPMPEGPLVDKCNVCGAEGFMAGPGTKSELMEEWGLSESDFEGGGEGQVQP